MNQKQNIEDLLRKFNAGDLLPQEAKELAGILKEGDDNEELKRIVTSYWDRAENADIDVPTSKLSDRLKAVRNNGGINKKYSFQRKVLYTTLKYAAVVLITFGITWFAKDIKPDIAKPIALQKNVRLHPNEISVLYGSKSKVTLPDGSTVNLNSGSILSYPASFDNATRNVTVQGEAYFEVKKDPSHPFYVKASGVTVRVLGTKFNVKSYPEEETVEMTLVTGKIELYASNQKINEKNRILALAPNEQAIFKVKKSANDSIESIKLNQHVDVIPIISWKDNRLMFKDDKFWDLAQKLERWYNVSIDIQDEKLKSMAFSGVFVKETIEQSLSALKLAAPFRYKMEKNQIIISRN